MNQSKSVCFIVILIAVGIGGMIRFGIAQQDWLWVDELHTAWSTNGSFADVSHRANQGNQSPLFFWLVWSSIQLLGSSELAIRMIALVSGIAVIVVAGIMTWKWTNSVIATLVVGCLIALDPWFVFYGTEARPYGLMQLLSLIQVMLFWRVLAGFYEVHDNKVMDDRNPRRSIPWGSASLLVFFTLALFYCHYTSIWLCVAELVFLVGYCIVLKIKKENTFQFGRAVLTFFAAATIAGVLCLPAIIHLLEVYDRRGNWALFTSPQNLLLQLRWPILLHVLLPVICSAIFYFPNKEKLDFELFDLQPTDRMATKIGFVFLWAFLPIAIVLTLDYFRIAPLALYRFTLVGAVAMPIFAGLCVASSGKWYGQMVIAIVVVGASVYQNAMIHQLVTARSVPRMRFENWADPINEINARDDKLTHPVFLFANLIEDVDAFTDLGPEFQEYLLFPINGVVKIDARQRETMAAPTMLSQHFRPTDIKLMKQQGGGWLIIRGDQALVTTICSEFRTFNRRLSDLDSSRKHPLHDTNQESDKPDEPAGADEPDVQFAQFPLSNVYLVSIDW